MSDISTTNKLNQMIKVTKILTECKTLDSHHINLLIDELKALEQTKGNNNIEIIKA